jgi:scyllo-inositol 2-dehydrogenase (NAD+)
MEKIKAAVIGTGRMGAEPSVRLAGRIPAGWLPISHAESVQAVEELELAAFADTDPARLKKMGSHYGVSNLFTDPFEMLDAVGPEFLCSYTYRRPY